MQSLHDFGEAKVEIDSLVKDLLVEFVYKKKPSGHMMAFCNVIILSLARQMPHIMINLSHVT